MLFLKHILDDFSAFMQFSTSSVRMSVGTFCRVEVHISQVSGECLQDHWSVRMSEGTFCRVEVHMVSVYRTIGPLVYGKTLQKYSPEPVYQYQQNLACSIVD